MFSTIAQRLRQKHRTVAYPAAAPALLPRFRGLPELQPELCPQDCRACLEACPTGALQRAHGKLTLDLGRCLFCPACEAACPRGAVRFTTGHALAGRSREGLVLGSGLERLADALSARILRLYGRSFRLREVSAGGCNACEVELNVLGTLVFDLGRFGVQFVASPRHADGIVVTGPVTENMQAALRATWEATPAPRLVIAVGACAISGGVFAGSPACAGGAEAALGVPVDLFVPGCPPHPVTVLDGLLRLLGRVEGDRLRLEGTGIVEG